MLVSMEEKLFLKEDFKKILKSNSLTADYLNNVKTNNLHLKQEEKVIQKK